MLATGLQIDFYPGHSKILKQFAKFSSLPMTSEVMPTIMILEKKKKQRQSTGLVSRHCLPVMSRTDRVVIHLCFSDAVLLI